MRLFQHFARATPWLAGLGLAGLVGLSLLLGRYPLSAAQVLAALAGQADALTRQVLWGTRLPRVLAALLVGAGLAVAGAAYQGVFRNPLVSPGLLGVLAGCACGAAAGVLLGVAPAVVALLATLGGWLAVGLALAIAHWAERGSMLVLLLAGLLSAALFNGALSLLKYLADPQEQLPSIVYWLLGSLASVDTHLLRWVGPMLLAATLALCAMGRLLDALSLDDDEAASLGLAVRPLRLLVIVLATATSALTVTLAGMVGWVGLLVPHLARLWWGPAHGRLLPLCALLGAGFVLLADDLARSLGPGEIPLGIVTELAGALVFVLLLPRLRRGWA